MHNSKILTVCLAGLCGMIMICSPGGTIVADHPTKPAKRPGQPLSPAGYVPVVSANPGNLKSWNGVTFVINSTSDYDANGIVLDPASLNQNKINIISFHISVKAGDEQPTSVPEQFRKYHDSANGGWPVIISDDGWTKAGTNGAEWGNVLNDAVKNDGLSYEHLDYNIARLRLRPTRHAWADGGSVE